MSPLLRTPKWRSPVSTRSYAAKYRPPPRSSALQPTSKPKPRTASERSDSETFTLPDSRTLGFSSYGPRSAPALLIFHGFPGSRRDAAGMVDRKMGIRVVGIDRPGMGFSTFQRNRRLLDWPQDVMDLTRYLGIQRFRVLGGSAGGPYALACAKAIPREILRAVGVASGFAPVEAGLVRMSGRERFLLERPSLLKLVTWWRVGRHVNHRDPIVRRKVLGKMARDMGVEEGQFDGIMKILAEPWRQGVSGYVEDAMVLQRPWGFDLRDVDARKILLWYGAKDRNTPIEMGRYMAERLEGGTLKTYPDDDHFTLMSNHGDDIVRLLMQTG